MTQTNGLYTPLWKRIKEQFMYDNKVNNNLIFKKKDIKFFAEDIEKMKLMNEDERIKYKSMLKRKHRYIVK